MGIISVQKVKTVYLPVVYTSLGGLCLEKADVVSMEELGASSVEWVTETGIRRLTEKTPAKIRAKEEMGRIFPEVEEQVYFRIKERSFFVDFYVLDFNIAVLIDDGDRYRRRSNSRDELFSGIGIRTVRVSEERVMDGHLLYDLCGKLRVPMEGNAL